MQLEQRLDRLEANLGRLTGVVELLAEKQETIARVQDESLDLIGVTVEGQARIASRQQQLDQTVAEIGDKLNALISVVDQMIRGKQN